ncbi:MAG: Flagellar biosynthesis protein FlhF [Syntrophus sp. SKADARSKE-3]|nr:Flagellar biosynthesis protein FlhF [Syntrophus sp. SKADARSKE-3]
MQIRRYEASSIREAIAMIKNDLGPEAIVLSTKRLGEDKAGLVEVMAATDKRNVPPDTAGKKVPGGGHGSGGDFNAGETANSSSLRKEIDGLRDHLSRFTVQNPLKRDMDEFRGMMEAFFDVIGLRNRGEHKDQLPKIYSRLVAGGVSRQRACVLIDKLRQDCVDHDIYTPDGALQATERYLRKSVMVAGRNIKNGRVKAFIGPTGVGKTTTLAKLAAHYAIDRKLSVGLITTDTFRIAAAEQLKVYAKILDIPLHVASDRESFQRALGLYSGKDVVLVDTPGRSHHDRGSLDRLNHIVHAGAPVECNLLLSLTSSGDNLLDAEDMYRQVFDYDHLIFTKTDECNRFGLIFNVVERTGKPVLYITNGQNVPQDIQKMTPGKLAEILVKNILH